MAHCSDEAGGASATTTNRSVFVVSKTKKTKARRSTKSVPTLSLTPKQVAQLDAIFTHMAKKIEESERAETSRAVKDFTRTARTKQLSLLAYWVLMYGSDVSARFGSADTLYDLKETLLTNGYLRIEGVPETPKRKVPKYG